MRRIPWLIVGVMGGTLWGGCACGPSSYYHNSEEYLFHLLGYIYGMWIGLVVGILLDVSAAIFRRCKASHEVQAGERDQSSEFSD
jgi:hypothetical protein